MRITNKLNRDISSFRSELDCIKIILELKRLKREVEVLKGTNIKSDLPEIPPPIDSKNLNDASRMRRYIIEKEEKELVEDFKESSINYSLEQQSLNKLQNISNFEESICKKKTLQRKVFPQINEDSFNFSMKNSPSLK
jgi:hypothetical protein